MAEKMLELQMQMRQNQHEITDFLTDLESWTSDIKKQDQNLKTMKPREQATSAHPPVRSAAVVEKVKKKRKEKEVEKPSRIKSSDYRKWEQLDVDAMLKQVDEEERDEEEEIQLEVEKLDEERRAKVAAEMKEKGNEHFRNAGYEAAIECYTTGMQADPASPVFPANRAMAYLKLKKYAETEADCTLALSLDPTYTKAYLRRGTARVALGKASSARKDFTDALKLEPGNPQARAEIQKLDKAGKTEKSLRPENVKRSSAKNTKFVQPVYIPPKLRSKKPLMRIEVQEVGAETATQNDDVSTGIDLDNILERGEMTERKQEPLKKPMISVLSESEHSKSNTTGFKTNTNHPHSPNETSKTVIEPQGPLIDTVTKKPTVNGVNPTATGNGAAEVSTHPYSNEKAQRTVSVPPHPSTSFQFQSDVKLLCHSPDKLYQYLTQIQPSFIPSLLKQQLETETLVPVLRCFYNSPVSGDVVFQYLYQFAKVRRFDMAIMLMSDDEKRDVSELFTHLSSTFPQRIKDVEFLSAKYGL